MKRFLLRIALLAALCLGVLLALSRLYLVFVGTGYLRDLDETYKFESVPYEIEYAGSGRPTAEPVSGRTRLPEAVTRRSVSICPPRARSWTRSFTGFIGTISRKTRSLR
jgi:hypothetical protein